MRTRWQLGLLLTVACGASSAEPTPTPDGSVADASLATDGGSHDSGTRDSGVDAGSDKEDDGGLPARDGGSNSDRDAGEIPTRDAGVIPSNGCGQTPPTDDDAWTLQHDGATRDFYVQVPDGYDPNTPTPVVFDFHGRLFTARLQMGLTHLRRVADDEGFIVVHGEGIGRTWNGGLCCGEAMQQDVDDVGFVAAMLDALEANLCVDTHRVYATGMSNGGFLSHRLACELSDRITAIAPVAGVLGIAGCAPGRAVPVLHFHGTDDALVSYDGFNGFLSVQGSTDGWVQRNGCGATGVVDLQIDDVTCRTWSGCDDGAEVRLCTIDGGGHTWPGGTPVPGLGRTSDTVDASEMMWEFFERFALP